MEVKDHMPVAYARRLAQQVAQYLRKRYGATKVLLFGSLALGGAYNPDFSDIDVCFEGVRDELVSSAQADCRLHFGERDTTGRKRIDYLAARDLTTETRRLISRDAEEI